MTDRKTTERLVGGGQSREWRGLQDYSTPKEALYALLEQEKFQRRIWEPCMGLGAISSRLKKKGHRLYTSDIKRWKKAKSKLNKRKDFLTFKCTPKNKSYDIITNPPYAEMAPKFIIHSLKLLKKHDGAKIAMLLKVNFLEGVKKYQTIFSKYPLKHVYVFSYRIPRMHRFYYKGKKATSMMAFAWYVWEIGYKGEPTIRWLTR